MKDQYWYCLHVKADQGKTQVTEKDERIEGFLTGLHFKSPRQFLGMMTECYSGMTSCRKSESCKSDALCELLCK